MPPVAMALVGLGKISVDQHIPAIRNNSRFALAGGVSPNSRVLGVEAFETLDALLAHGSADAVAINTPPQIRFGLARKALLAGKHVLLEKPPCATVAELLILQRIAGERGVTLYTGWHSQHAPAVAPAGAWLADKCVSNVTMRWCENVRQWHPGQRWIWQVGGLGVFDPGINALSILTAILPCDLAIDCARFDVPANCQTPIAADLSGSAGAVGRFSATLDFRQVGLQTWNITIETDRGSISLTMGGAEQSLDGASHNVGPSAKYPSIYRRFAELIDSRETEVDVRPLRLVADAFLISERVHVEEFVE